MASPQQAGRRCDDGRIEETLRRAKLHLSAASGMLDCAASAVYRARELAGERVGAGDELAENIVAVRSSARMLVDVLGELKVVGLCPEGTSRPHIAALAAAGQRRFCPAAVTGRDRQRRRFVRRDWAGLRAREAGGRRCVLARKFTPGEA